MAQFIRRRNVHGRSFYGLIVRGKVQGSPVWYQPLCCGSVPFKRDDRSGDLQGEGAYFQIGIFVKDLHGRRAGLSTLDGTREVGDSRRGVFYGKHAGRGLIRGAEGQSGGPGGKAGSRYRPLLRDVPRERGQVQQHGGIVSDLDVDAVCMPAVARSPENRKDAVQRHAVRNGNPQVGSGRGTRVGIGRAVNQGQVVGIFRRKKDRGTVGTIPTDKLVSLPVEILCNPLVLTGLDEGGPQPGQVSVQSVRKGLVFVPAMRTYQRGSVQVYL